MDLPIPAPIVDPSIRYATKSQVRKRAGKDLDTDNTIDGSQVEKIEKGPFKGRVYALVGGQRTRVYPWRCSN